MTKCALRKEFIQPQVDIVGIVEVEQPVSVGLTCKPLQIPVHGPLRSSWRNGFEIRSKSLFTRSVNVEDLGKAEK